MIIMDRRDLQGRSKQGSVFPIVSQQDTALRLRGDRLPQLADFFLVAVVALKKSAIRSHHFARIVAGDLMKRGIADDDGVVRLVGIRDQDTAAGRFDRPLLDRAAILRPAAAR